MNSKCLWGGQIVDKGEVRVNYRLTEIASKVSNLLFYKN